MSFSKNDLDTIKSKIKLSSEFEKKVKVIKKGNDYWCCCPFHDEKTPSCKINDDLGSYYCFGCGAKGDIFTFYTDIYNFSFPDAVKELAQRVGIQIIQNNFNENKKNDKIFDILELSTSWFQNNLKDNIQCKEYLKNRFLSSDTIEKFRIGFSYNANSTLYKFLKDHSHNDEDIIKSNLVKIDTNKKIRDFFYKRLIFPISNTNGKIVGFGGRVLDNSNPKYINSPESFFFKKRNILYNLNNAKSHIRSKKNMLICEGYMDVISLYENKIKTAVAPLGTSLTESQIKLAWNYTDKPTIMFDGDQSGLRASYKSALMVLPFLIPNKYLQFINLPKNLDPDSFINNNSFKEFIDLLKQPISIVDFIFEQSSSTVNLDNPDHKISFDKYLDDLVETIKDKKIKYFYKNEFKNLFFKKLKNLNNPKILNKNTNKISSLLDKQIFSFLASFINHKYLRKDLYKLLVNSNLLNEDQLSFLDFFHKNEHINKSAKDLIKNTLPLEITNILEKSMENSIFQLFPYSKNDYESNETLKEIEESVKNINTRLSNLKKINKSLNEFEDNFTALTWDELKKLKIEINDPEENLN
ncbi:MAG: DNA primase [Pelagibacteraceae bacterium TMED237]|nr:MAG: DNA primase [Pelagibacteraceae bacterium TMED237]|tara:strand:+ start:3178 stop:4923 length:1746 start_codon:yes stop_codon:yes gene_type:complete